MKFISGTLTVLVLAVSGALVAQSPGAASGQISVSSLPSEFVIGTPNPDQEKLFLEIFVTSKIPQQLIVEFVDFYTAEDGSRSQLPAGSTPYSLSNALKIRPFDGVHNGRGIQQRFEVIIEAKDDYAKTLFTGGVSARVEPLSQSSAGVGSQGSILRAITVTPYGLAATLLEGELLPAQILRHDLTRLSRSSFIDSVLPDIPGVVNFGAVKSTVTYENVGEYPVFAGLDWEFNHAGAVIASKKFRPSLISPGQKMTKEVATEISGQQEGSRLNLLPELGFVSNKISLSSSLGGTNLPVQTYDGSFLVIQWKEPFVGMLSLYFFIRWAWRRNLSPKQRAESASLLGLAFRSLFRKFRRSSPAAVATNSPVAVQGYSVTYPPSARSPEGISRAPYLAPPPSAFQNPRHPGD
jgi:hypothetical protein